jgi:hypothetical protein
MILFSLYTINFFGVSFAFPLALIAMAAAMVAFILLNRHIKRSKRNVTLAFLRIAAIASLFLVLAMPYKITEESINERTTSILVVEDGSESMAIYERGIGQELLDLIDSGADGISEINLKGMNVSERSPLGDTIYENILGSSVKNNVVVLVSDGNNNHGSDLLDVAAFAAESNTRIYGVLPGLEGSEVYIKSLAGASKSPVNSEYSGRMVIEKMGGVAEYHLTLEIDNIQIVDTDVVQEGKTKELPFQHIFNDEGPHTIVATITPTSVDRFTDNNVFRKTVQITERPNILLVTKASGSPLNEILDEVYDVRVENNVPSRLDSYDAVVLDNIPESGLGNINKFRTFLGDGGGILVVGGNDSYSRGGYYESEFEGLLPVRSVEAPKRKGETVNIVILIDISGSTGMDLSGDTKIDVEKAIAVKMVKDLGKRARIGVVAFNYDSFLVSAIREVSDPTLLIDKVSRLRFGGGTNVLMGLLKAEDVLKGVEGSKYIILISDGVTNYPVQAFNKATSLAAQNIIIHTIGVGFDTDESFMIGLARRGNGIYFAPRETERVKILIGELDEGEDEKEKYSMVLTDTHHFITETLGEFNVSIEDFNEVTAKSSSQILAASSGLKPALTVWRFGLGRVASLGVDNGFDWAGNLYAQGNSKLVSSAVNWIIGDPGKSGTTLECMDTHVGEESLVIIRSEDNYPQTTVGGQPMASKRLDENTYFVAFYPEMEGFVEVSSGGSSCVVAVNGLEEYSEFGVDTEQLTTMSQITGGEVFSSDRLADLAGQVSEHAVAESQGVLVKQQNMQIWFALAALVLFFLDIVIRRVQEIRQKHA